MKFVRFLSLFLLVIHLNGCATMLGGPINEHQLAQKRSEIPPQLREGYVILDLLTAFVLPGLFIDFETGAIYKPNPRIKTE